MEHQPYGHKVDVYSFGVVLWELVTCQLPFKGLTEEQIVHSVVKQVGASLLERLLARVVHFKYLFLFSSMQDLRPTIPMECDVRLADLIKQCWRREEDMRPEFRVIVAVLEEIQREVGLPPPESSSCCTMM